MEKKETHARFRHLLREVLEVGQRLRPLLVLSREEEILQLVVAHGGNLSIRDVELLELVDIDMGGRRRDLARSGDGPHAEIELQ